MCTPRNALRDVRGILLGKESGVDGTLAPWHGGTLLLSLDVLGSLGALVLGRAWASLFFLVEASGAGYRVARLPAEGRATAARQSWASAHTAGVTSLAIHCLSDVVLCWAWALAESVPDRLEGIKTRIFGILHKIVFRIISSRNRELGLQLRRHG